MRSFDPLQTQLAPEYRDTTHGRQAQAILRACVHCGFCNATCPTYQLLGDELDGPRGRIYLIKQVLEGQPATRSTQQHLDRCLSCRSCETTCPSGVAYSQLLDIGRAVVDARLPRPPAQARQRLLLRQGLPSPLFGPVLRAGQALRRVLPANLRARLPQRQAPGRRPRRPHPRRVLLLEGCVQPAMAPNINAATARVLDAAGIECLRVRRQGCCGGVKLHLSDLAGAKAQARANIDAWWPELESGRAEAVLITASGCGVTVKDYGRLLQDDAAYAERAARVSALTRDVSEYLPELARALKGRITPPGAPLAWHPPCSLQHGLKLRDNVLPPLRALGFDVHPPAAEAHWCCGAAGTYSVLQPDLAQRLRSRKLEHLLEAGGTATAPAAILTANMACAHHLQAGTELPVRHWIEALDAALTSA